MDINKNNIYNKKHSAVDLFLLLSILEGTIAIIYLFSISPDPKNAFIFGFSKSRLVLIGISIISLTSFVLLLINKDIKHYFFRWIFFSPKLLKNINLIGGIFFIFLWFTIWIPPYRFEIFTESFIRLKPLLLWGELITFQLYLTIKFHKGEIHLRELILKIKENQRLIIVFALILILLISSYLIMLLLSPDFPGKQLFFPPGAPLSGLQVFLSWIIFVIYYIFEKKIGDQHSDQRKWNPIIFFLIWALTFLIWNSIPLECSADRPGPFPPNNICYPQISDSVFSIGSHYINLGQGIYHHWLTDKPLYLVFLSIGQWIFGPSIDQYLLFQIAVIALIPAILYLTLKNMIRYSGGLLLSVLFIINGINSIILYRKTESTNVKLENSELLTALLLILLYFVIFKWLCQPTQHKWAILSGGILGCSVLVRMTPIFIAPIILLVIMFLKRESWKHVMLNITLFILTFSLVFIPWLLSANDVNGNNYYYLKIQEVISSRFTSKLNENNGVDHSKPNVEPLLLDNQPPLSTLENKLNYFDLYVIEQSGISGIFYHFMNNEFSSLAKLPTQLLFYDINTQVGGSIWNFDDNQPIWKKNLSLENYLSITISLILVIAGVLSAYKKFGISGLSGIIIQTGYYAGNAIGQTSGGRYLEPVSWVTLLYYCMGIYTITSVAIDVFRKPVSILKNTESLQHNTIRKHVIFNRESEKRIIIKLLFTFAIIGLILPIINNLPSKLPEERNHQLEIDTYKFLSEYNLVSKDQWVNFLASPQSILVQGKAYHPAYLRSTFYASGTLSFELMVLAKDHVYVSYMPGVEPQNQFGDGSNTILIGCRIGEDTLWGANRIIIESFSIIQLDHEKNILSNPSLTLHCN